MTDSLAPTDRAKIVVIGAGVAGLGSALALSRAGHRVTLIERDATPLPADPDAAFEWDRRGAPQVRHSHALLARLRNLLRDRYPDVLADLLAAGATELRFTETMPEEITDRDPRPGDEDLVALACRRTTFEWVLRRTVLAAEGVTLLDGVTVDGLATSDDRADGEVPRVTGVHVARADGQVETLPADVVVGAVGRRSGVPRWLAGIGVELPSTEEDTGIVYLSRFYRLRPEAEPPPATGPIGGDLGYLKYAVFQGDNRTFSVTFATATGDDALRSLLLDPAGFDLAAACLPTTSPWVERDRSEAITPVHVMGGLLNRQVDYLDDAGRPRLRGFHAVGDAHTCTNPLYGRGCSLAMVGATLLADALDQHPDDDVAVTLAYEAAAETEVHPWYLASVTQDRLNREQAAHEVVDAPAAGPGETAEASDEVDPKTFMRDLMREGLMPAVRTDATVFRAFVRAFNLLDSPDALMADADVINRVMAAYAERDQRPPEPPLGPPRAELMAVLEPA
ncbi:MAG TPA: FAD-dependent oxidoreductase [Acidimicrobiales bacterium]